MNNNIDDLIKKPVGTFKLTAKGEEFLHYYRDKQVLEEAIAELEKDGHECSFDELIEYAKKKESK